MSEKIQMTFDAKRDTLSLGPDSTNALRRQRPPCREKAALTEPPNSRVWLVELGFPRNAEAGEGRGTDSPATGYMVHMCGASMRDLTTKIWMTTNNVWTICFVAVGAEVDFVLAGVRCFSAVDTYLCRAGDIGHSDQ